jgi:hypothetical protein
VLNLTYTYLQFQHFYQGDIPDPIKRGKGGRGGNEGEEREELGGEGGACKWRGKEEEEQKGKVGRRNGRYIPPSTNPRRVTVFSLESFTFINVTWSKQIKSQKSAVTHQQGLLPLNDKSSYLHLNQI